MYKSDVSKNLVEEMILLKKISLANLGDVQLSPLQLLNKLHDVRLESSFASASGYFAPCQSPWHLQKEASFSQLKRIKSYGRSTALNQN